MREDTIAAMEFLECANEAYKELRANVHVLWGICYSASIIIKVTMRSIERLFYINAYIFFTCGIQPQLF